MSGDWALILFMVFVVLAVWFTKRIKRLAIKPRHKKKVKVSLSKKRQRIIGDYQKGKINYSQMQKKLKR